MTIKNTLGELTQITNPKQIIAGRTYIKIEENIATILQPTRTKEQGRTITMKGGITNTATHKEGTTTYGNPKQITNEQITYQEIRDKKIYQLEDTKYKN